MNFKEELDAHLASKSHPMPFPSSKMHLDHEKADLVESDGEDCDDSDDLIIRPDDDISAVVFMLLAVLVIVVSGAIIGVVSLFARVVNHLSIHHITSSKADSK